MLNTRVMHNKKLCITKSYAVSLCLPSWWLIISLAPPEGGRGSQEGEGWEYKRPLLHLIGVSVSLCLPSCQHLSSSSWGWRKESEGEGWEYKRPLLHLIWVSVSLWLPSCQHLSSSYWGWKREWGGWGVGVGVEVVYSLRMRSEKVPKSAICLRSMTLLMMSSDQKKSLKNAQNHF